MKLKKFNITSKTGKYIQEFILQPSNFNIQIHESADSERPFNILSNLTVNASALFT